MILAPARNLATRLKCCTLSPADTPPVPLETWYARVFHHGRKPLILATEATSYYGLILEAKGITTPEAFAERLLTTLENMAAYEELGEIPARFRAIVSQGVRLHKPVDRRIIGIITHKIIEISWALDDDAGNRLPAAAKLNRAFPGPRDLLWPVEALTGKSTEHRTGRLICARTETTTGAKSDSLPPLSEIDQKLLDAFMARSRPPAQLREQVDLAYRIEAGSLILFETRRVSSNPSRTIETAIAKATFIDALNVWKIYRQRSDMKWHIYAPVPQVDTLGAFLRLVEEDAHTCFFG